MGEEKIFLPLEASTLDCTGKECVGTVTVVETLVPLVVSSHSLPNSVTLHSSIR